MSGSRAAAKPRSVSAWCAYFVPTDGTVLFEGHDITHLGAEETCKEYRRKTQMVFQDPFGSLNPRMTISDIVGEGLVIMGEKRRRGKGDWSFSV